MPSFRSLFFCCVEEPKNKPWQRPALNPANNRIENQHHRRNSSGFTLPVGHQPHQQLPQRDPKKQYGHTRMASIPLTDSATWKGGEEGSASCRDTENSDADNDDLDSASSTKEESDGELDLDGLVPSDATTFYYDNSSAATAVVTNPYAFYPSCHQQAHHQHPPAFNADLYYPAIPSQ